MDSVATDPISASKRHDKDVPMNNGFIISGSSLAGDNNDVDLFYKGVVEDLRRRGLDEMAEGLLRIHHKGSGISLQDVGAEKSSALPETSSSIDTFAADHSHAREDTLTEKSCVTITTPGEHEEQQQVPSNGSQVASAGEPMAVEVPDRGKSAATTQRQPCCEQQTTSLLIDAPERTVLVRSEVIGQGFSVPGAFNIDGQSQSSVDLPVRDTQEHHFRQDVGSSAAGENTSTELPLELPRADGNGHTLEAIRVDDIMTVKAEPFDEVAPKRLLILKILGCFVIIIGLVLALRLSFQRRVDEDENTDPSTIAPTLGADARFPLLREFFIDIFSPLYDDVGAVGNTTTSKGRQILQKAFEDPESPQYHALEWLAFQDQEVETNIRLDFLEGNEIVGKAKSTGRLGGNMTNDQDRLVQRYVLAVLYYTTEGPSQWLDAFEFLNQGHECNWSGALRCTKDGYHDRITHIDLRENGLVGSVPAELAALVHLESIIISFNELTGTLPASLAALTALREVDIAHNSLFGTIPEEFYTQWLQLETFRIGENQFSGSISPLIGNLEQLKYFGAERLYWTGTVPKELFQRLTNLEFLEFSNQMIGFINDTLATEIGLWTNLQSFVYHGTEIRGTIPTEIGLLTQLSRLQLNSNHLTGTIPSEMGMLRAMSRLAMSFNALTGALPSEVTEMTELSRLELQNTFLTGDVGFLCKAIEQGVMKEVDPLQFDLDEVSGCSCCTCCMY